MYWYQCASEKGSNAEPKKAFRGAFLRGCVTNRADDLVVFFECVWYWCKLLQRVFFGVMVLGMVRFIFASGRIKLLYW